MKKFEQLKRLYSTINRVYGKQDDSEMYISGLTSDFDRLFELSWKTLKEYLFSQGFKEAKSGSPKSIIKLAYQQGLLDGVIWIDMLDDRNDDAHLYNESEARSYAARIHRLYLPEVQKVIDCLLPVIPEETEVLVEIPDDFLLAKKRSGLDYDEFLTKVKTDNGFSDDSDVFLNWDKVKNKYITGTGEMHFNQGC